MTTKREVRAHHISGEEAPVYRVDELRLVCHVDAIWQLPDGSYAYGDECAGESGLYRTFQARYFDGPPVETRAVRVAPQPLRGLGRPIQGLPDIVCGGKDLVGWIG